MFFPAGIGQSLVINEDLFDSGVSDENLRKVSIVYLGTHSNQSSGLADVVLPAVSLRNPGPTSTGPSSLKHLSSRFLALGLNLR